MPSTIFISQIRAADIVYQWQKRATVNCNALCVRHILAAEVARLFPCIRRRRRCVCQMHLICTLSQRLQALSYCEEGLAMLANLPWTGDCDRFLLCWRISDSLLAAISMSVSRLYFTLYRATLGVVILSVCPSVRPSVCHTRALLRKQTTHCGYFDTTQKDNHSSFLSSTVVGGRYPLHLKFALKVTHPLPKTLTSTDFRL